MRLAIAGGGTGGHLTPGIALAEEFLSQGAGHEVLFLGAHGGLEERLLPRLGFRVELLPSLKGGLRRFGAFGPAYIRARRILLRFRADVVVGLGGYASAAPIMAAWGVEIPSMLLEQNLLPGRANRWLARLASEIGVQFAGSAEKFPSPERVRHVGNPLRAELLEAARQAAAKNTALREPREHPTLLVLGGSQGARALNEVAVHSWSRLQRAVPGVRMILVSGERDRDRATRAFAAAHIRGQVVPFCNRLEELYAEADVVVARAGATTLAELAAFALPSILIPYPHATKDHQTANARLFAGAGAAWCMEQKNVELDRLARRVADVLLQPERRRQMAQAALRLAKPRATKVTAARLIWLAGLSTSVHPTLRTGANAAVG